MQRDICQRNENKNPCGLLSKMFDANFWWGLNIRWRTTARRRQNDKLIYPSVCVISKTVRIRWRNRRWLSALSNAGIGKLTSYMKRPQSFSNSYIRIGGRKIEVFEIKEILRRLWTTLRTNESLLNEPGDRHSPATIDVHH